MASFQAKLFQAKIGRKRMRKRENKNYSSVSFLSDAYLKIPKKLKKYKWIYFKLK